MNPGFLLVISILIQLTMAGILKQYFPVFLRSTIYPYVHIPLSSIISIALPSYLYLKCERKSFFTDFWQEIKPGMPMILAFFIGFSLQFVGIAANAPVNMLIESLNEQVKTTVPQATSLTYFLISIITFALIPSVFEEIFFRGIIFNYYRQYGNKAAILISAILFSLMHFSVSNTVSTFILGLIFGMLFARTNRLIYPVMAHFALNLSACILTYIPNFPMIHNFYKDYYLVFVCISFPLLFLLLQSFVSLAPKKHYADEEKFNRTKEYMLDIDDKNSLKVFEHDIRENNTVLAFRHLVLSPYFYIIAIIYIYLGGSVFW